MDPLLVGGYTLIFVTLFGYIVRLQRRLSRLEQRLDDAKR